MGKVATAVAFALGLALLGIGLPDLLGDTAKVWVTVAGAALLIAGVVQAVALGPLQAVAPRVVWDDDTEDDGIASNGGTLHVTGKNGFRFVWAN